MQSAFAKLGAPSHRALWAVVGPSILFTVLTHGFRLVDQYWVQFISMPAQAAVGSSVFAVIVFYGAFEIISAGAGPLIARASGRRDEAEARKLFGISLVGAVAIGLLISVVGSFGSDWMATALGLTGQTHTETSKYLRALSLTILPLALTPVIDQVFLALGNARAPTVLHALSLAANALLTPLFILHFDMGVEGAAYASNLARGVATAIGVGLLVRQLKLRWSDLRVGPQLLRLAKIGAPMAGTTFLYSGAYWALLATSISPLGPHVNAALGIGYSGLEAVSWPVFHGLALGAASFVGRYLGAGRPDQARRIVMYGWLYASLAGLVATAVFHFGAHTLTALFSEHPAVQAAAAEYALLLAYSQLATAWESLADGVLSGAGDTRRVFWWSVPFNLGRVPLAYILALTCGWGAAGVWWAINITAWLKAAGKGWEVVRGEWQRLEP